MSDVYIINSNNSLTYALYNLRERKEVVKLIIIVNNKSIYNFFINNSSYKSKLLFVNCNLKKLYSISSWYSEWKNVRFLVRRYLKNIHDCNIIIFDLYYNLLVIFIYTYLSKTNMLFLGIKDQDRHLLINAGSTGYSVILKQIYNIKFTNFYSRDLFVFGAPTNILSQIQYLKEPNSFDKSSIWNNDKVKSRYIDYSKPYILITDYIELQKTPSFQNFLNIYSKYNIYTKLHPVHESISEVKDSGNNVKVIKDNIPIEFIDLSGCFTCLGLGSLALSNLTYLNTKVISLLYLAEYSSDRKIGVKSYLKKYENTTNNIAFPNDTAEILRSYRSSP